MVRFLQQCFLFFLSYQPIEIIYNLKHFTKANSYKTQRVKWPIIPKRLQLPILANHKPLLRHFPNATRKKRH
ncbi:hypothetical protein C9J03_03890 [Photobacterium gaetbulicola]|nr:hypothetical protein C9J03_03890 [Photobacterium gaetbulicola]